MPEARLHDGSAIQFEIRGEGRNVILPLFPHEGTVIDGLSDRYRVIAPDFYAGHLLDFTPEETLEIIGDFLDRPLRKQD